MHHTDLFQLQRTLRQRLFEGSAALRWRPGRELAAQLLLYLDDPQACWQLSTEWLRDQLDADRVDGGFGGYVGVSGRAHHYQAQAETQRSALGLPAVLGQRFDARNPGLRAVWQGLAPVAVSSVLQERSYTAGLRQTLLAMGTAAKLAVPVHDGQRPVGLLCADWRHEAPRWHASVCNELGQLARTAIGPVLAASAQWALERQQAAPGPAEVAAPGAASAGLAVPDATQCLTQGLTQDLMQRLTQAERKVAELVATGLSYKDIARQLDRSLSTVDHQLRQIRSKLGARSTARLVHLLNGRG